MKTIVYGFIILSVCTLVACQRDREEIHIIDVPDKRTDSSPDKSQEINLPGGDKLKVSLDGKLAADPHADDPDLSKESILQEGIISQCVSSQCGQTGQFTNISYDFTERFSRITEKIKSKMFIPGSETLMLQGLKDEYKKDLDLERRHLDRKLEILDSGIQLNETEIKDLKVLTAKMIFVLRAMLEISATGTTVFEFSQKDQEAVLSKFSQSERPYVQKVIDLSIKYSLRTYTTIEEFIQKNYSGLSFEQGLKKHVNQIDSEIQKAIDASAALKFIETEQTAIFKDIEAKINNLTELNNGEKIFVFEQLRDQEISSVLILLDVPEDILTSNIPDLDFSVVRKAIEQRLKVLSIITEDNVTSVALHMVPTIVYLNSPQLSTEVVDKFNKVVDSVKHYSRISAKEQLSANHHKSIDQIIDSTQVIIENLADKKDALELHLRAVDQKRTMEFEKLTVFSDKAKKQTAVSVYMDGFIKAAFDDVLKKATRQSAEAVDSNVISFKQIVENSEVYKRVQAYFTVGQSDNSNRFNNVIVASRYSAEKPEIGLGVLSHEVGHLIYNFIAKNNLSNQVKSIGCVNDRNKFKSPKPNAKNVYLEEDWADNFSSRTLEKVLQNSPDKTYYGKNMGCFLLNYDKELGFSNNKLKPADKDVHSSALLRLIMIAADRKLDSQQCKALVSAMPRCM